MANLSNVLNILQMALNAAPAEIALVHSLIQTKKSGGVTGLLGAIFAAAPDELALVASFVAAAHANNQKNPVIGGTNDAPIIGGTISGAVTEPPAPLVNGVKETLK